MILPEENEAGAIADRPEVDGRGGARPGAGRPKGVRFAVSRGDMKYARLLASGLMRDESQPMDLRAHCAVALLTANRRLDYLLDLAAPGTEANHV